MVVPPDSGRPAARLVWFGRAATPTLRGMTRAILDFPAAATEPTPAAAVRLSFGDPRHVISAAAPAEVPAALAAVEAAARAGSWAVGFVAYEAAPAFDAALVTRPPQGPAPLLWFGVFDAPACSARPRAAPAPCLTWHADTLRDRYDEAIRRIRCAIAAGDVYQVNHTLRFHAQCEVEPLDLYDALVAPGHGRYSAFIETDAWAVVSASPELFFDIRSRGDCRRITTRPMKGTIRRGRWSGEDAAAAARLAASAKDRAENLMIVDLLRNDLGRVARFGSVHVPAMFALERYPTVHQMTSTVAAELRDGAGLVDVFRAMFPCGSVTGAPKVTAMRSIAQLEDSPRGVYCGAVGVVRPDGSATFNVAIRTLLLDRAAGRATYGAGGGITWDSRAAAEYDEVTAKAALLSADAAASFQLLETLRCDHGEIPRIDLHMRRLAASAAYWEFAADTSERARAELRHFTAAHPNGRWRLRLTAQRDGSVRITHTPLEGEAADLLAPAPAAPLRVSIAARAVARDERLLFHKTTARAIHQSRRADDPDAFDVLMFNAQGEATEFTTGNLVAEIDGRLLTPARDCGLLDGTMRQQLLDAGAIREAIITLQQVRCATRLWHVNSVGGCRPVALH